MTEQEKRLNEILKVWSKKDLWEQAQNKNAIIAQLRHRAEVAEERLKKLKKTEGDLTVKEELVKYKIAFDKAIKLAYKIRTDFDVLSCSSCEFGYAIDTCKEIGLYNDCENRWKEELLQQTEKELSGEKNND